MEPTAGKPASSLYNLTTWPWNLVFLSLTLHQEIQAYSRVLNSFINPDLLPYCIEFLVPNNHFHGKLIGA